MSRIWCAAVAAFALGCAASAASAAEPTQPLAPGLAHLDPLLQWDPTVRQGRLPNGLRYLVRSGASPKGAISLRLGFDVGSYEETDQELGVAHFVEHMGFNGTRRYPENRLDTVLAPLGVGFGRDQNASTSLDKTVYEIDLPTTQAKELDLALTWLRDVADGMLFDPAVVTRETGVVQAERESHAGVLENIGRRVQAFQLGEARSVHREPIGTAESIAAMTPERLRRFYDHWYRPENAVLVIIGDLPVEALEQQVRGTFGDWVGRGPAGVRAPRVDPPGHRAFETNVQVDAHINAMGTICRVSAADAELPPPERMRMLMLRAIWGSILEHRLQALKSGASPTLVEVSVVLDGRPDANKTCAFIVPAAGRLQAGLGEARGEIDRFAAEGPSELELEGAIEEIRSKIRGAVNRKGSQPSSDAATDALNKLLDRYVVASARDSLRSFDLIMEGIGPAQIREAFAGDWRGWGPLVSVVTPEPISAEAVRTAYLANGRAPPVATATAAPKWAYESFGPKGKVVRRDVIATPGFVRLTFANGAILNFKQTSYQAGSVDVRVRFGSGRREIAPADLAVAEIGAGFLKEGGLGKASYEDLEALLRNGTWGADLVVGDDSFSLSAETTTSGLSNELDVLAAYLSDPGFRPSLDTRIATAIDATYRIYRTAPQMVVNDALQRTLDPASPNNLPPKAQLDAVRSSDFARLLRPALTQSPLEVTIVGDLEEAAAIAAVSTSIGALPPRKSRAPRDVKPWYMRFPEDAPEQIHVTHEGGAEQAMLGVYWPLYVATPARRTEEYALLLLAAIMGDELRHRIREDLGMTYAPDAKTFTPDFADQGYLAASVVTRPRDAEAVLREIRATATRLAKGEISPEALEAARQPMLSGWTAFEATNDWWANALSYSTGDGQGMRDLVERRTRLRALTLDDVKAVAATWLGKRPVAVVAMPETAKAKGAP